jgi:lambda repressor-like predicted transcriptional regulator
MTARKLSDSEKQEIVALYRRSGETSSSLAAQYGVSSSTISRVLKSGLPADEYEALIQQKRAASRAMEDISAEEGGVDEEIEPVAVRPSLSEREADVVSMEPTAPLAPPVEAPKPIPRPVLPQIVKKSAPTNQESSGAQRRSRRRSGAPFSDSAEPTPTAEQLEFLPPVEAASAKPVLRSLANATPAEPLLVHPAEASALNDLFEEDLLADEDDIAALENDLDDEADDFGDEADDFGDEADDFGDDDEEEDEEGASLTSPLLGSGLQAGSMIQVLPFSEALLPRICYLVVDRGAELITRPLQEFGDLGQIPEAETQEKTLPIFDNHRVAKRYSNPRNQRVIKLPDGRLLQKAAPHLQAKGITRLLIDGRVYSL